MCERNDRYFKDLRRTGHRAENGVSDLKPRRLQSKADFPSRWENFNAFKRFASRRNRQPHRNGTRRYGRVTIAAEIVNNFDLGKVAAGELAEDAVRRIEVADALIDTGATSLCLPASLIQSLGLRPVRQNQTMTAAGPRMMTIYSDVLIKIFDRDAVVRVVELPERRAGLDRPNLFGGNGSGRSPACEDACPQSRARRRVDLGSLLINPYGQRKAESDGKSDDAGDHSQSPRRTASRDGQLAPEAIHSIEVADALVDTGASTVCLPPSLIALLGLVADEQRKIRTAGGVREMTIYSEVALTIQDRQAITRVVEVPEGTPVLIGQIPLEEMDLVVHPLARTLVPNPAHGGEWTLEVY